MYYFEKIVGNIKKISKLFNWSTKLCFYFIIVITFIFIKPLSFIIVFSHFYASVWQVPKNHDVLLLRWYQFFGIQPICFTFCHYFSCCSDRFKLRKTLCVRSSLLLKIVKYLLLANPVSTDAVVEDFHLWIWRNFNFLLDIHLKAKWKQHFWKEILLILSDLI